MLPDLIQAAGGLGILLLGMVVMTDGLRGLAGEALQGLLARWTRSPTTGALTGALATAAVQSSSATTLAAVGFAGAGLLTFSQALGIIFGANLGTTITGWLVALFGFKLQAGDIALPLILVGALLRLMGSGRVAASGFALAGFGAVFVGIDGMREGLAGFQGVITPNTFPADTLGGRALLVGFGFAITAITQSSSAGVATAMTLLSVGAISFAQAGALVIGMDVGTTLTALIATIGGTLQARRTGAAHVIYNCLTGFFAFWLLPLYVAVLGALDPGVLERQPELCLVGFHTLFNGLGVVIVLPFTSAFADLIVRLLPDRPAPFTDRLDRSLLKVPTVAIAAVTPTLHDLFGRVCESISRAARGARDPDDDQLDLVELALGETRHYLEQVTTSKEVPTAHVQHVAAMHVVDHLDRLIDRARETDRIETLRGSPQLQARLRVLTAALDRPANGNEDDEMVDAFQTCWRVLRKSRENDRRDVLARAARGEVESTGALAELDALRWLRRVARHCWRISKHMSVSPTDAPKPEPEDRDLADEDEEGGDPTAD